MKHIVQTNPHRIMVKTVVIWPKCDFCGSCHPDDPSKCPRIKSFDETFMRKRP